MGPLTAAAPRNRPSIFHRRAAAAAAAAQISGTSTGTAVPAVADNSSTTAAGAGVQPQIVVPAIEMGEGGITPVDIGQTSSVMAAESPATEVSLQLPAPGLTGGAATEEVSTIAADGTESVEPSGSYAVSLADDSGYFGAAAHVAAPASPGPCVQPVTAEAALMMRYGAVLRGRAGRVAASTPSTPVGSAGGAVGPGAFASAAALGGSSGGPGPTGAMTPGTTSGVPSTPGAGAATAAAAAAMKKPVRSIMFKHVRFNRMHARLTYEGPPLSINGFGLVLDNRVYRNIDGGWTTVLNR